MPTFGAPGPPHHLCLAERLAVHHAQSCTQHHLLPSCQQGRPPGFLAEPPSEGRRCRSQVTGVCKWQDRRAAPRQSASAGSFSLISLSGARGAVPLPVAALQLSICASRTRSCGNSRTGLVTQAGCMTRKQAAPFNTVSCRRPAALSLQPRWCLAALSCARSAEVRSMKPARLRAPLHFRR